MSDTQNKPNWNTIFSGVSLAAVVLGGILMYFSDNSALDATTQANIDTLIEDVKAIKGDNYTNQITKIQGEINTHNTRLEALEKDETNSKLDKILEDVGDIKSRLAVLEAQKQEDKR